MKETFYVYNKGDQYQLRLVENHYAVSTSSSKEGILTNLDLIVRNYKSRSKFIAILEKGDLYRYSKMSLEQREMEYLECKDIFSEEVKAVVSNALKEVREDIMPKMIKIGKTVSKKKEVEVKPTKSKTKVVKKFGMITL